MTWRFGSQKFGPFDMPKLIGVGPRRIHVDKGYRSYNHLNRFRVWISGQVRRTTKAIRREMKHRAAIEPVIGHLKAEHRMDRKHLKGCDGDRINAVLADAGYNFAPLVSWLTTLWRALLRVFAETAPAPVPPYQNRTAAFFTDTYVTYDPESYGRRVA
jgi:IS5 family transposase